MKLLNFKFILTDHRKEFRDSKFSYDKSCIYEYEGDVAIFINGKKIFEAEIAVLEFLRDVLGWQNNPNKLSDMKYDCVETEDNPLVSFIYKNGRWFIDSPWKLFDCETPFTREELEDAILKLKADVEKQLNIELPIE